MTMARKQKNAKSRLSSEPAPVVASTGEGELTKCVLTNPLLTSLTLFKMAAEYQRDVFERSMLFFDVLRLRANNMLEHERAGLPLLLAFKYDVLMDARQFSAPVNYSLLKVTEADGCCLSDCLDANLPPVVILDPRAGHGPGIGGFKSDSEVGVALRRGHPVYFVSFFPEPVPGQTLADVLHSLRQFVEEVSRRHPGKPPILYGNCQAGWAVALLSADCQGVVGPAVLNGSPLSYWAGDSGINPMRISGGLLGGAWLTHLMADLGFGRFDGAWLAQNFENLKPEKAICAKYADLFRNVDTEEARFLEFERWWNGFYFLSREEMLAIVENLFIGNKLEKGEFRICDGCYADLRNLHNPLVIFASYGDNITPPHQALGWIPAVYTDTDDLKRAGQRIVYLTNPHVGHLGIFVSAAVALKEHRAILESLKAIEALPPGLYQMLIVTGEGHEEAGVRFEEQTVESLHPFKTQSGFERVRLISEFNEALYRNFVSPWVRAFATPLTATVIEKQHPMRLSRYVFSEAVNPGMNIIRLVASFVRASRTGPLPSDHPLLVEEAKAFAAAGEIVRRGRELRDAALEGTFSRAFE